MSFAKFRPLFESFQNLNLVFLIEDLKREYVAFGEWIDVNMNICPLGHNWRYRNKGSLSNLSLAGFQNNKELAINFINWWDGLNKELAIEKLLFLLKQIFQERLDDADIVQKITQTKLVTEDSYVLSSCRNDPRNSDSISDPSEFAYSGS